MPKSRVLRRDEVGELWRVESRLDLDDLATLEAGRHGGLVRDLGSHPVDQVLSLLGPGRSVYAELDFVDLPRGAPIAPSRGDHARRWVQSHLSSTNLNRIQQHELRAYGSAGSYLARGTDVLAQAIFAGLRPAELGAAWGYESEPRWGTLRTASGARSVPSEQGAPTRTTTRSSPPPCAAGPRSRCPQPRRCAR
jgi:predicted dehydrogenase